MKKLFISLFITTTLLISCQKNTNNNNNNTSGPPLYGRSLSNWLYVDSCLNLNVSTKNFTLCFDTVLTDSRCPIGSTCVWKGVAAIRLKYSDNTQTTYFRLATDSVLGYKIDTTFNGINFKLDSLLPHPAINNVYPYQAFKAKIIVSQ